MIRIDIPGPPTAKGRPRFARATGRAYTPAKTVNAEAHVKMIAAQAMAGAAPFDGPLTMRVVAALAIPGSWSQRKQRDAAEGRLRPTGRPDVDNFLKLYGDALNGIVWRDDAQVVEAKVSKHYSKYPHTVVEIAPLVIDQ